MDVYKDHMTDESDKESAMEDPETVPEDVPSKVPNEINHDPGSRELESSESQPTQIEDPDPPSDHADSSPHTNPPSHINPNEQPAEFESKHYSDEGVDEYPKQVEYQNQRSIENSEAYTNQRSIENPEPYTNQRSIENPEPYTNQRSIENPENYTNKSSIENPENYTSQRSIENPENYSNQRSIENSENYANQRSIENPENYTNQRSIENPENYTNQRSIENPENYTNQRSIENPETYTNQRSIENNEPYQNQNGSSVYDFNDSVSEESHDLTHDMTLMRPKPHNMLLTTKGCEENRDHSVSEYQSELHISQSYPQTIPQTNMQMHSMPQYPRTHEQMIEMNQYNANDSYEDSLSVVSDYSNPNCYEGIRRARGRPRGSKNGTGMGRSRARGYRFSHVEDRSNNAYDLRHIPDPFSCQRRGRPRSRFIVDLGEQNHEAWTKSKEELNISDAELTTLLLSLLESRKECKETVDSDTILGLVSSEYKKWKEKFGSQLSMLSHYASIHNSNCCTCLGIKKKKYTPAGTGKRGRPRKYPPPVGYGPGMQRPEGVDDDGNIFEPQIILKDGMVVKADPDDKEHLQGPQLQINGDMMPRPLTQEEIEKRREYYNNHKNKIKYVCHYCQVHFYHKPNFDYHISKLELTGKCKIVDKVNNLYLCDTCGEGFSWREKLEKHLRLSEQHGTHNQKELLMYGDFQCNICGKTFNKRTTYMQHVKWHEEREDIPCVICGTMFKQTEIRRHLMEIHSNDSLPCSYCGKLFTSRKYLEKHELVHQGGNFPCPECGKIFTQKCNMQEHLRSHSLEKEYPCEACGQMLNQKIGLCHHLKKHFPPSEFSYECEICAHFFANDYFLKYHKKKIHNIPMEGIPDEEPDYMSSPLSSQMSATDEEREKAYGAANNVVKNMLGVSLMNQLDSVKMSHLDGIKMSHLDGVKMGQLDGVNLTMKHEGADIDEPMRDDIRDQVHLEEIRHMERAALDRGTPRDPMDAMRMDHMQVNEELHMPQDLTRMAIEERPHLSEDRMSHIEDSPRMTDTPMDRDFRMTATPGYLAEHLRRMAENQSRMDMHYDSDNYRLDNLRSMSRGSVGDNLSHMGVIRPSQSATAQWPPHMQNHSALEGMNQSAQANQHALYPLPFWPYDPSLRQYHH